METKIYRVSQEGFDREAISRIAATLDAGGIVAVPTETVYGLAVSVAHVSALERLRALKGRGAGKPFTYHVGSLYDFRGLVSNCPAIAERFIRNFWPGPLTLVFPSEDGVGIGIRFPDHLVAQSIFSATREPVIATSANLSGEPPDVEAGRIIERFSGEIEGIVDGGPTRYRAASTVVRIHSDDRYEILRVGVLSEGVIHSATRRRILFVCTGNTCRSAIAEGLAKLLLATHLGVPEHALGARGFQIESAGTGAMGGRSATDFAIDVLEEIGVDLRDHISRPVTPELVSQSDVVYTMTRGHLDTLLEWLPEYRDRMQMLDPEGRDIQDPVGLSRGDYKEVARVIQRCLQYRLKELT